MVSYLQLMQGALPEAAKESLAVAKRFISGEAGYDDLNTARVRAQEHLMSMDTAFDFSNTENLAIRAASCSLMTNRTPSEFRQTIEYFLQFAGSVQDNSSKIHDLLQSHFG
jgi:hypothetical protein